MSKTKFKPHDPNYDEKVRSNFARQQAMETIGIEISELELGYIVLIMPYSKAYCQQHDFIHAGIITTALDSACGYAAFSLMDPDAEVLTVEFKTNLFAPAVGESFQFRAEVVKSGRTLTICEAKAFSISKGTEKLIASMTGTLMTVRNRGDVSH